MKTTFIADCGLRIADFNHQSRRGFVLVTVIVFLGVMGVVLAVLAQGNITMLAQTDRMYLQAVETNLISSGAAWTSTQLSEGRLAVSDQPIQLDAKSFAEHPCSLAVRPMSASDGRADVRIATSCTKARWKLSHSHVYTVSAP